MRYLTTQSDADTITAFLAGREAALSPALQRKLKRMETVTDLLRTYGSRRKVATMLQRLDAYTSMGASSQATAYRDIQDAIEVFGTQSRNSRDFYVDRLFEMMYSTREKAIAADDLKTAAACEKNIADAIKNFLGAKEAVDWSKLLPPRILVGFMPELLNVPLPADIDAQVAQLLKAKRKKSLNFSDAEEAQVIDG